MAIEYVSGVPYEYSRFYGHTVRFPEDWQGDLTEVRLAEDVGGEKVKEVKIEKLPACVRKLYIPAGIQKITLNREVGDGIEEIEVDAASKYFKTDGHALYSADGKELIRLMDQRLETYTVAEGTERLDLYAFLHCKNLHRIFIPDSVQTLGMKFSHEAGFAEGCSLLEEVVISPDNPYLKSEGKAVYSKDGKTLVCVACDGLGEYAVAEGTEWMEEDAFGGRVGLNCVSLPVSLQGSAVTVLSKGFHLACDNWRAPLQFKVAKNNPYIRFENNAFCSADGKILLQVLQDTENYEIRKGTEIIAPKAFDCVPSLKKVVLPEGIKVIGERAFWKCKSLVTLGCQPNLEGKRFIFPASLEEIGENAFSKSYSYVPGQEFEEIWLGENIRIISNNAFEDFKIEKFISLGSAEIGTKIFGTGYFSEMSVDLLLLPNISPSKIKKSVQEIALLGYCTEALLGNVLCEAGKKDYQAFLKRNKKRYLENVEENLEVVRYMMACSLIEDTDIDGMIERVDGEKNAALKAELINYSKRFTSDGFDREIKKMDQEAKKAEKKQKKALAKEEYEALPLSERAGMKYKLSPQAKVELLEEAVLFGTLEDLKNVCKVHGPFELTARALGMAVRCRTADFTQELLNNSAVFAYESTPAFTRKYDCLIKVSNSYSYTFNYAMLIFEEVDRRLKIEKLGQVPVAPVKERCRSIEKICAAGTCEATMKKLLYHAIMNCEEEMTATLKACGVNRLSYGDAPMVFDDNFVSMTAKDNDDRFNFLIALPLKDADKLHWVLNELLEVGNGLKIHFSGPELTGYNYRLLPLCAGRVFELVMTGKVDISKAKPTEIINCCLKAGNIKGLQYALDQGWASDKKALNKAADKLEIKDAAVLEWLNQL